MKIKRCRFTSDYWGFYFTPILGFSWNKEYGKVIWIGWGFWLFEIVITPPEKS